MPTVVILGLLHQVVYRILRMQKVNLRVGQILKSRCGEEWIVLRHLEENHIDYKYGHRFICRDASGNKYAFSGSGRFRVTKNSDSEHDLIEVIQDVEPDKPQKKKICGSSYTDNSSTSDKVIGPSTISTAISYGSSMDLF